MGRVRERPRLVVAQVLAIAVVAAAGVLIGMALKGDDTKVPAATQQRLDRAERSAAASATDARTLRTERDRARASGDRARRRARALARSNRSLRSGLRRTRRALARARP
jgi:uncharacterized membrane protein YccC